MVGAVFCLGLFVNNLHPSGRLSILGFGAIFFLIGCGAVWELRSAHVIVDSETVEFKYGRVVKRVRRSDIKKVYTANGFMVLDTGTVPRIAIPLIFSESRQLFSLLKTG
jgi:hypothetical protein